MSVQKRVARAVVVMIGVVLGATASIVFVAPSAVAADCPGDLRCNRKNTTPTSGVRCEAQEWAGIAGWGYRGKCVGTPDGVSRGYRYRMEIRCTVGGSPSWSRGRWENNGAWSQPSNYCPNGNPASVWRVDFQFR